MKFAKSIDTSFIANYRDSQVPWGPVGYVTYKRTYARMTPEGITEEWWQTVQRCCNGLLDIDGAFTQAEIQRLYHYVFNLKCNFSGRALWQLGTENVKRLGGDSLQNCWAVAVNDPIDPFTFTFNELMLGGGVGFNITPEYVYEMPIVKHSVSVERVESFDCDFIVPDNREGWVQLLECILKAFYFTGKNFQYCTKAIRERGLPIKGFGGVASGSDELVRGIGNIVKILQLAHGRKLKPIECLDILNIIGSIVVAGNVRRSAQIACGSADDFAYMNAKNWSRYSLPRWRQQSNNSVFTSHPHELPSHFWEGYEGKGEPYGLVNLNLCRQVGRLADGLQYRPDPDVIGVNPCLTGDTWIHTTKGPKQVRNLMGIKFTAFVDGEERDSTDQGFFYTGHKSVMEVTLVNGMSFKVTEDHQLKNEGIWTPLSELNVGDSLDLHDQTGTTWCGDSYFNYTDPHFNLLPGGIENTSSQFHHNFLLSWQRKRLKETTILSLHLKNLQIAQRMLARLGIMSTLCWDKHQLIVTYDKQYQSQIKSISPIGTRNVYDCTIPNVHYFDGNGVALHNCAEITLASHEACNLAELYLPRLAGEEEFREAAKLCYMGVKTISRLPFIHPKTNAIVEKNRRLGIGVTGFCAADHLRKPAIFDNVYNMLEEIDVDYSETCGINQSIKLTTVKPSGTNSLLPGVPPGVHPEFAPYYIRRITFAADDKLVDAARKNGFNVNPKINLDKSKDFNAMVVDFPIASRKGSIIARDLTAVQQLENQKFLQTHWADNAVSMTCYYRPNELPEIQEYLNDNYETTIKTASFLLHSDHGFDQAPYEEITEAQYHEMASRVTPITSITDLGELSMLDSLECPGGSCPVK